MDSKLILKDIALNRKARFDYYITETYEAGLLLKGTEVKSVKAGMVNVADAFGRIDKGEVFLYNMHISPYAYGNINNSEPTRKRKLLLHKSEINRINGKLSQGGLALIPLKVYLKGNLIKIELGLGKTKKLFDKRETIKKREVARDIMSTLKGER